MRFTKRHRTSSLLLLATVMAASGGCTGDLKTGGGGLGSWFAPKGEPWAIQCLVLAGAHHRESAEAVAEVLGDTPGIDGRKVKLEHKDNESTVYYGKYVRRIDPQTRRPEVTDEMNRDMRLNKELGVPGQGHYFAEARFVPLPTPDVGNPAWSLEQARGVYTLRVALFANEPGFYERKEAAAKYVEALRKQRYPAFYYHGPIHSEVFVGEFGEDAVQPVTGETPPVDEEGGYALIGFEVPSREVRALRAKENFAYELWNLRRRGEMAGGRKVYNASKLVRVRELLKQEDEW